MAQGGGSMPSLSYNPPPNELGYYEGLFNAADVARSGSIGGKDAVAFFSLSKLPVDLLKNIWTMADNPQTNSLDRRKFFIAVRLIQFYQNGQKAQGASLVAAEGTTLRPPFFEGVTGTQLAAPDASQPSPQTPSPQQQQYQPPPQQEYQPPPQQYQPPPQQYQPPPQEQHQPQQQQQQYQPPPQQQYQPPPAPGPMQQAPAPAQTTTLAAQDPYIMNPNEQSRYEALFSQYQVKHDGYVYGKEAVALFSKSGLEKDQLRDVWNLVDEPVDNRLSTLEFAIAMHLIVCISKKKLPVPLRLPPSLQALKDNENGDTAAGDMGGFPSPPPVQQYNAPPPPTSYGAPAPPSPQMNMPHAPEPPPPVDPVMPPVGGLQNGFGSNTGMSAVTGGLGSVSISAAFDDLSPEPVAQNYSMNPPAPSMGYGPSATLPPTMGRPPDEISVHSAQSHPHMAPQPVAMHPQTFSAGAIDQRAPTGGDSSKPPGDESEAELINLRAIRQKLQAENVSLKAQLGSMTEEEREVHKEISETVADVARMSQELTTIRASVADAKSKLIESTAELKALKEKKSMMTDLISDAQMTESTLREANENVQETLTRQQESTQPTNTVQDFGSTLFDFGAPTPAPPPSSAHDEPQPWGVGPVDSGGADDYSQSDGVVVEKPPGNAYNYDAGPEATDYSQNGGGMMGGHATAAGGYGQPAYSEPNDDFPPPMGGRSPAPPVPMMHASSFGHQSTATAPNSPTSAEIELMRQQANEASQQASEAEATRQMLSHHLEELKAAADQADKAAMAKSGAPKKKAFGRSNKKQVKEADKLMQEAADARRRAVEAEREIIRVQSQAMQTKRRAEQIQQQIEEAEIAIASSASYQDTHEQQHHMPPPQPVQLMPPPQPVQRIPPPQHMPPPHPVQQMAPPQPVQHMPPPQPVQQMAPTQHMHQMPPPHPGQPDMNPSFANGMGEMGHAYGEHDAGSTGGSTGMHIRNESTFSYGGASIGGMSHGGASVGGMSHGGGSMAGTSMAGASMGGTSQGTGGMGMGYGAGMIGGGSVGMMGSGSVGIASPTGDGGGIPSPSNSFGF